MSSPLPIPKRPPLTKELSLEVKELLQETFPRVLVPLIEGYTELEVEICSVTHHGHNWNVTCVSLFGELIQRQLWYSSQSGGGLLAQHDILDSSKGSYEYFSWYPEGPLRKYGSGNHWGMGRRYCNFYTREGRVIRRRINNSSSSNEELEEYLEDGKLIGSRTRRIGVFEVVSLPEVDLPELPP